MLGQRVLRFMLVGVVVVSGLSYQATQDGPVQGHPTSYCGFGAGAFSEWDGLQWFDEYSGSTGTVYRYYTHYWRTAVTGYERGYRQLRYCGGEIDPYEVEDYGWSGERLSNRVAFHGDPRF